MANDKDRIQEQIFIRQLAVGKKMHFGSKSVKGIDKKQESKGKT